MPATGQQTVKSVPARTGFVAEAQTTTSFAEPCCHFAQDLGAVLENPDLPYLATASALGDRHAHRRLVDVQSDICDIVHSARPPCMRLNAGHPAQPSTLCMPRDGPPITQRTSGLVLGER